MKEQKNNKGVIILLIVIILILSVLCVLFATGTIQFKSNESENNGQIEENNDEVLDDQLDIGDIDDQTDADEKIEITNLTFGKPYAGGIGGGTIDTLVIDVNTNLKCNNNDVAGIQISGYCLDKNNNKYEMRGPVGVMAFYCDNNSSHVDSGKITVEKVYDSNGKEINTTNIKWEQLEIKYCKIDKANIVGNNGEILSSEKELNYEKNF